MEKTSYWNHYVAQLHMSFFLSFFSFYDFLSQLPEPALIAKTLQLCSRLGVATLGPLFYPLNPDCRNLHNRCTQ